MNRRFNLAFVTMSSLLVTALLVGTVLGRTSTREDAYKQLAVFTEVLSRIKSDYVEEPDLKGVTMGAINGLLESIDPYASYLSADQYKQFEKNKTEKKADVGLTISKRYGYLGVVDALPESPAAKAGLKTGDIIEAIQDVSTRDMPLAYADMLLKGEAGSAVELTVMQSRKPESHKITLTRAYVPYPAVKQTLVSNQTGWIAIQSFEPGKLKAVASAVENLQKQGAKRLVLDLRDCSTGTPEDGIQLANLFMDKGVIATLKGQRVSSQTFEAVASKQITKLPLAVITNRGTSGAVEIAAAALLDSKRAEIIGERTYGDAAMRKAITMEDGSAIILAVAKYQSPSGKVIQDVAVTPSVPLSETPEQSPQELEDGVAPEAVEPTESAPRTADDPLLKKAIDVLLHGAPKENPSANSADPAKDPKQTAPNPLDEKPLTTPKPNQ